MTEQSRGETGRFAPPARRFGTFVGQAFPHRRELFVERRPVGHLDSLGELVERQPSREKMLAQRSDRLLTVGLGGTPGRMIQRLTTLTRSVELGEARRRIVSIPSSGA